MARPLHPLCLICICVTFLLRTCLSDDDTEYEYAMVIDAGSSHSKLFVYRFEQRVTSTSAAPQSTPIPIGHGNSTDPISKLTSQEASDALISQLIAYPQNLLSEHSAKWFKYPIYLKATAGMRVLSTQRREEILNYIAISFNKTSINPFLFDTTYAIIASGEEEATFDWLGVNYAYDTLINTDHDEHTYGALDMGGQSTQIAFAPEPGSNILADFTAVRLWDTTHRLYTHSHLQYGMDAVEQRIAQMAYDEATAATAPNVTNACLNVGVNISYTVDGSNGEAVNVTQFGSASADLSKCGRMLKVLLANDTTCYVEDCAFNGVYLAEIPQNMIFVAFSAFGFTIEDLNLSPTIDLAPLMEVTTDICNMSWTQLKASDYYTPNTERFIRTYCRGLTYIYTLLKDGYGFAETDTPIIFATTYEGQTLTWTQGSILRDANWLPYDVEYQVSRGDGLGSEGKMWRIVGITAVTLVAVVAIGCTYLAWHLKKAVAASGRTSPLLIE